jgi:hypothetical protein
MINFENPLFHRVLDNYCKIIENIGQEINIIVITDFSSGYGELISKEFVWIPWHLTD